MSEVTNLEVLSEFPVENDSVVSAPVKPQARPHVPREALDPKPPVIWPAHAEKFSI